MSTNYGYITYYQIDNSWVKTSLNQYLGYDTINIKTNRNELNIQRGAHNECRLVNNREIPYYKRA